MGTFGWCGTSPVSSSACIRLTSFPMCSPMSIDAGCGGSRTPASPHGGLLARIKGPGRRYTGVCVELTPGLPSGVSRCRSARAHYRYLHNSCCIRGGARLCTYLPWGKNLRRCCLLPRPVGLCKDASKEGGWGTWCNLLVKNKLNCARHRAYVMLALCI